jgi:hypothetical protein
MNESTLQLLEEEGQWKIICPTSSLRFNPAVTSLNKMPQMRLNMPYGNIV